MQNVDIQNMKMDNNKTYFFPFNLGSGNRGCEGIIRGIINIFGFPRDKVVLLERDCLEKELDVEFHIDDLGELRVKKELSEWPFPASIIMRVFRKIGLFRNKINQAIYNRSYNDGKVNDCVFFTGGDLYCYKNMICINNSVSKMYRDKGYRLVLYGCSIEPSLIDDKTNEELRQFDAIVTRESLSTNALKEFGISDNVFQCPDPAFSLKPEVTNLPDCFEKDVVGLNVSNLVNKTINFDDIYEKSICAVIEHIINNTDFNILLVPHVTWYDQDDRVICGMLYEKYKDSRRISCLKVDELNYLQIRYVISNCRFFLGARTHSVISAYSTCVPCVALGYSIKSRGIAQDLHLPKETIVNCKNLDDELEIVNSFKFLVNNEKEVKNLLETRIPEYCKQSYLGKPFVEARIGGT